MTTCGGRQGCKIGGVIFGAVYVHSGVVKDFRRDLRHVGLMWSEPTVPVSEGEHGWESGDGLTQVETCVVTFVDDEALFFERKSPHQLIEDTEKVLAVVSSTFRRYRLKLDWRPGKSEILMSQHGSNQGEGEQASPGRRESRDVGFPSDLAGDPAGPMESLCGPQVQTLRDGMFGHCDTKTLYCSAVHARIATNCGSWKPNETAPPIADSEVRRRLGAPSIECMLIKARLQYLGRVCRREATSRRCGPS